MFTSNPFAELSATISPTVMQTYIVIMIILVAGGTLYDIVHKKSAKYFFNNWRNANRKGTRQVGGGEMVSLAVQTAVVEGLTSAEFCDARRRIAHLLTMYGFLAYVVTTAIMVFWYPTSATPTPAILPLLWTVGACWFAPVVTGSGSSFGSMSPPRATHRSALSAPICSSSRSSPA